MSVSDLFLLKHRLPAFHYGGAVIAILEAAFEDGEGVGIEELFLDGAFEVAGTEEGSKPASER